MELFYSLIPTVVFALVLLLGVGIAILAKQGLPWTKKKRSPFTSQFLRVPGQSIQKQVEDLRLDVFSYFAQLCMVPMMLLLIPLINYAFTQNKIALVNLSIIIILGTITMAYWFYKLFVSVKKLQQVRLGFEGEVAVGQELIMIKDTHLIQ